MSASPTSKGSPSSTRTNQVKPFASWTASSTLVTASGASVALGDDLVTRTKASPIPLDLERLDRQLPTAPVGEPRIVGTGATGQRQDGRNHHHDAGGSTHRDQLCRSVLRGVLDGRLQPPNVRVAGLGRASFTTLSPQALLDGAPSVDAAPDLVHIQDIHEMWPSPKGATDYDPVKDHQCGEAREEERDEHGGQVGSERNRCEAHNHRERRQEEPERQAAIPGVTDLVGHGAQ